MDKQCVHAHVDSNIHPGQLSRLTREKCPGLDSNTQNSAFALQTELPAQLNWLSSNPGIQGKAINR